MEQLVHVTTCAAVSTEYSSDDAAIEHDTGTDEPAIVRIRFRSAARPAGAEPGDVEQSDAGESSGQ